MFMLIFLIRPCVSDPASVLDLTKSERNVSENVDEYFCKFISQKPNGIENKKKNLHTYVFRLIFTVEEETSSHNKSLTPIYYSLASFRNSWMDLKHNSTEFKQGVEH